MRLRALTIGLLLSISTVQTQAQEVRGGTGASTAAALIDPSKISKKDDAKCEAALQKLLPFNSRVVITPESMIVYNGSTRQTRVYQNHKGAKNYAIGDTACTTFATNSPAETNWSLNQKKAIIKSAPPTIDNVSAHMVLAAGQKPPQISNPDIQPALDACDVKFDSSAEVPKPLSAQPAKPALMKTNTNNAKDTSVTATPKH